MAQDDYYYEIQLTNKQLVFYFMAGASGLVLSFLAGIMVGRGVDPSAEVQAAAASVPAYEDKIIREEPPVAAPKTAALPAEQLTYTTTLQSDKLAVEGPSDAKAKFSAPAPTLPPTTDRRPAPRPAASAPVAAPATVASHAPAAVPAVVHTSSASTSGSWAIQVAAFKDKASAQSVVGSLKKKGYAAYVDDVDSGLFAVRVGQFPAPADAEPVKSQLRAREKYQPFLVKQ